MQGLLSDVYFCISQSSLGGVVSLQMSSDLRFPLGVTTPICDLAVAELLNLLKRVSHNGDKQYIIEIYKRHFCKISGDNYTKSSSLSWAESDLEHQVNNAANDAPGFISAVVDSLEDLSNRGINVPTHEHINAILARNNVPFIIRGNVLVEQAELVPTPQVTESSSNAVSRALSDAKSLIGTADASSSIDRAHTALHGYMVEICYLYPIELPEDPTVSKAFKSLRTHHPAFQPIGHRADQVTRILNSFAAAIDAFSTLRNHASLAHVNELLMEPEATATLNAMFTVFRYTQDCLQRYNKSLQTY